MANRISHSLHASVVDTDIAPGMSFDAAKVHVHDMDGNMSPLMQGGRPFRGIVNGVHMIFEDAGDVSVDTVTFRICADAAGDHTLVSDTFATLWPGISDGTKKSAYIKLDLPLHQVLAVSGDLYLFVFVSSTAGTPKLTQSIISWTE